jgi:quercetin dioxygenase-like cupin family protein
MTGFRPFFNSATGEWIEFTEVAEDNDGQLVRFSWRSVPGGVITEHVHPHQEERFIVTSGEARFTIAGEERIARAGETIVVPAGVAHSEGNPGPGEIQALVELRPALRSREFHEAVAGPGVTLRWQDHSARRAAQSAPAGRDVLALPPREPGHLAADRGAERHAPAAVGPGEGLRGAPVLRPVGHNSLLS